MWTRMRGLLGLSWLDSWGWPFLAIALLMPIVTVVSSWFITTLLGRPDLVGRSDGLFATCSRQVTAESGTVLYTTYQCPSPQWGGFVREYVTFLPFLPLPFLWLVSRKWGVRWAALAAGLLGVSVVLVPALVLQPYVGAGPVTFIRDMVPVVLQVKRNGTTQQILDPALAIAVAYLSAWAIWFAWLALRIIRFVLDSTTPRSAAVLTCPQCGHRHVQPHLVCKKCGAMLAPDADTPAAIPEYPGK